MPLRLIEISTAPTIRLVNSAAMASDRRYAALSYCWGTDNSFRLLAVNIETLWAGVPVSTLLKTYRDAIVVCQQWLRIDYL